MRTLKKVGIALLVIVFVLIIVVSVTLWYVFTPEKLTQIVNKQAKDYLTCNTKIEKIEPTFFSTYPFFGVALTNLSLTENPPKTDTLFYASKCHCSINLKSYLFNGNIIIDPFLVEDGYLNFKIDSLGHSNFDIFESSSDSTADSEALSPGDINISNVEFKHFNANYVDEEMQGKAKIQDLNVRLGLKYDQEKQHIDLDAQLNRFLYSTSDSMALSIDVKNCDLKINSNSRDQNLFDSDLKIVCDEMSLSMFGEEYLSNIKFDTHAPLALNVSENSLELADAKLIIDSKHEIAFNGNAKMLKDYAISTDIKYSTGELDIEKVIPLIPETYAELLEGITAKGSTRITGTVTGLISDTLTPVLTANIDYYEGEFTYVDYPTVKDIKASMLLNLDMNYEENSEISIKSGSGRTGNSSVFVKGNISQILGDIKYDITASGEFRLTDFETFIPGDLNLMVQGETDGNMHTRFSQSALDNEDYHRFFFNGDFNTRNLQAVYDTIQVNAPSANIKLNMPGNSGGDKNGLLANIKIDAPNLKINMAPEMGASIQNIKLSADVNNLAEGVSVPITSCSFTFDQLVASYDTLTVKANNADGLLKYVPILQSEKEIADVKSTINSEVVEVAGNHAVLFDAKKLFVKTNLVYDESQEGIFQKYQPDVDLRFSDANYNLSEQLQGKIPIVSLAFNPDSMQIEKADLILGNSDFGLTGKLTNISNYLNNEALLTGNFDLTSENTDVYQLMDIFNGLGNEDSTIVETESVASEAEPFMVPKGIEIRLNTLIKQSIVNDHIIENIKGGLTVKDGTLILDQMGFTNKAANMQLTAMYRSERKNHLFTGIDFHLLNIDIAELIALVPSVDTIIPMLKSFKGKGEFHLAGETYLKSDYSPKQSTIRGAAAFQGQELTLMDTETFDMIANKLMFRKKTENVVDSLSVEMTLFRDEVDLYPFLIVMDKYKAVISGRHNMDNSFNYHISVTDTPLPVRLGLNVTGTIDDLKYDLVPCKYKHLYNPEKQGALESQTLRLKNLISESLKENVREVK